MYTYRSTAIVILSKDVKLIFGCFYVDATKESNLIQFQLYNIIDSELDVFREFIDHFLIRCLFHLGK